MPLTRRCLASLLIIPGLIAGCGLTPNSPTSQNSSQVKASSRLTEWDPNVSKVTDLASGTLNRWDEMKEELKQMQGLQDKLDHMKHMYDFLRGRLNTIGDYYALYPNHPAIKEAARAARGTQYDFDQAYKLMYTNGGASPEQKSSDYTQAIAGLQKAVIPVLKDIRSIQ